MTFSQSIRTVLKEKYATFSGRASRSEYWWFALFTILVVLALYALFLATGEWAWFQSMMMIGESGAGEFAPLGALPKIIMILYLIFALAILVPGIAVVVRRLHDRNMSGWWYLGFMVASMIPFIGIVVAIAFLVILCLRGTVGENRFGPDPLA